MLTRGDIHDPGIGFITLTRVVVSPDLQLARVFYTSLGDEKARKETSKALDRATPYMRRQIGGHLRPAARQQHRHQVAAGGVAGERDAPRIGTELRRVAPDMVEDAPGEGAGLGLGELVAVGEAKMPDSAFAMAVVELEDDAGEGAHEALAGGRGNGLDDGGKEPEKRSSKDYDETFFIER